MQLDELDHGHHMLWGALTDDDHAELTAVARGTGRPTVSRPLASSITAARQSLEIDGRTVPEVLTASARDGQHHADVGLTASFAAWIREHEAA